MNAGFFPASSQITNFPHLLVQAVHIFSGQECNLLFLFEPRGREKFFLFRAESLVGEAACGPLPCVRRVERMMN